MTDNIFEEVNMLVSNAPAGENASKVNTQAASTV